MRMPIIKVTPSSPSPDPNHPDYPEFFEDKLYLEQSARNSIACGSDENIPGSTGNNEVSLDSFSLVLDPEESGEDDVNMIENVKLYPQRSLMLNLLKSNLEPENEQI